MQAERYNDILDHETFAYMYFKRVEAASFTHALYITGHENNTAIFNHEVYQQFPYDITDLTLVNFAGKLNIPMFFDNGCILSIIPKLSMAV